MQRGALGRGADARVPGPQTPLGLWLREVRELPHIRAGWVMGGVKVRRESNLATRKNVLHPNPRSPPTLDHNVLGALQAGESCPRKAWGAPRARGGLRAPWPRRLCSGYQAESVRLKMVSPVTAVLRHLRKEAEHGHPRGMWPQPSPGSRHLYVLVQLCLQNRHVDHSFLTAAGNRGQSLARRPRVSEGRPSCRQKEELLYSRRPLPPGLPRTAGGRVRWPAAALPQKRALSQDAPALTHGLVRAEGPCEEMTTASSASEPPCTGTTPARGLSQAWGQG